MGRVIVLILVMSVCGCDTQRHEVEITNAEEDSFSTDNSRSRFRISPRGRPGVEVAPGVVMEFGDGKLQPSIGF